MQRIILTFLLGLALIPAQSLKADIIRTFAIEDRAGVVNPGGAHNLNSTLSGFITIDTTTGQALYGDILYSLRQSEFSQPFNPPLVMQIVGNATNYGCLFDCMDFPDGRQMTFETTQGATTLHATISTPTDLVDYLGGDLCYYSPACAGDSYTYFIYQNFSFPPYNIGGTSYPGGTITATDIFFTGRLVLVGQTTSPEPSTWIFMGTGALGLIGTMKRRLFPS